MSETKKPESKALVATSLKDVPELPPSLLTECMQPLVGQERFADVVFVVGTGAEQVRIPAHSVLLAGTSVLFETMLFSSASASGGGGKPQEIVINDTTPAAFRALLECIYTDGVVDINTSNLTELIAVSKKYQLDKLLTLCINYMTNDMTLDNAMELYEVAPVLLGDDKFGLEYIGEHSDALFERKAHLGLSAERFSRLVVRDDLSVSEVGLFKAVIDWAEAQAEKHKGTTRDTHLLPLLKYIRFPTMTLNELASVVAPSGLVEQGLLLELFKFVSLPIAKQDKKKNRPDFPSACFAPRVGKLFDHSNLITKENIKDIRRLFGKKEGRVCMKLLYRGTRDGMNGANFHSKCDGTTGTFTIARASSGNVFGGFYGGDWGASSGQYDSSSDAWIYSLKNVSKKVVKFIPSGTNYVYCNASYGPTWGAGHDLCFHSAMSGNSNYCNPNSYMTHAPDFPTVPYNNSLIAGAYNFTVEEIEVFSVKTSKSAKK